MTFCKRHKNPAHRGMSIQTQNSATNRRSQPNIMSAKLSTTVCFLFSVFLLLAAVPTSARIIDGCQLYNATSAISQMNEMMTKMGLTLADRSRVATEALSSGTATFAVTLRSENARIIRRSTQALCPERFQINVDLRRQPPVIFRATCVPPLAPVIQGVPLACRAVRHRQAVEVLNCREAGEAVLEKRYLVVESGCQPMKRRRRN